MKQRINIVWLKRDLRLSDHQPLKMAIDDGLPVLLIYIFEPSIISLPQTSIRHWRFIHQSLESISRQLETFNQHITMCYGEAKIIFEKLVQDFDIHQIYSHLEVGFKATFDRDKELRVYFNEQNIPWQEISDSGIIKDKKNRKNWEENRIAYLASKCSIPNLEKLNTIQLQALENDYSISNLPSDIFANDDNFQKGGEENALIVLNDFLNSRFEKYLEYITKPFYSKQFCSRLSAYLAYGCISIRTVYQSVNSVLENNKDENLEQYLIRLFWRSHYMQKLETEWQLEFEPTNKKLGKITREEDEELFSAFTSAKTGFPIIDAGIRSLKATGYTNFRIRSTLVTFATFTLWQDWRKVATYLASLFLDFEPGIHYGQIQVQAGLTGYHTLRLFSPTAQAVKHDQEGLFVKKWLPELKDIPTKFITRPWNMTMEQQEKYNCILGKDYPQRIVDFEIATGISQRYYWKNRQKMEVFDALPEIFEKHCLPKNIPSYLEALRINKEALKKNIKLH